MSANTLSQEEVIAKIFCPFCSAPWTVEMINVYEYHGGYCETCAYTEARCKITCHKCDRLIYEK